MNYDIYVYIYIYIYILKKINLQEEAGRLKFVCYSNDVVDEHMVWYLILFFLSIHVTFSFSREVL